jgi:7,8-dihydropterin-6-yl-methyl-4-(beta-D-ribofuranosyl)aminobenzene 5'-phosphate synthase
MDRMSAGAGCPDVCATQPVLDRTLAEFTKLGVRYTVPGHCTGWRANAELSRLLPHGFIQSSVETTVRFGAQLEA